MEKEGKWIEAAGRLIKPDGSEKTVIPSNGKDFKLEELKKFVGGWIEIIRLNNEQIMVINEEGKLEELPVNMVATKLFQQIFSGTSDFIVGTVLICHQSLVQ